MTHALITVVLALVAWPMGAQAEVAALIAMFYCGREHAQAEYRVIKSFYGGKRANAPWWCGFEMRAWNLKSFLDWAAPVLIAAMM